MVQCVNVYAYTGTNIRHVLCQLQLLTKAIRTQRSQTALWEEVQGIPLPSIKRVAVTDAMQNIAYEETNLQHTYDYADPDIHLQHTGTVLIQLGNHEGDHPLLTSKLNALSSPPYKHLPATIYDIYKTHCEIA